LPVSPGSSDCASCFQIVFDLLASMSQFHGKNNLSGIVVNNGNSGLSTARVNLDPQWG
jgi:hypothetical protein